jgi:hypothetical protein
LYYLIDTLKIELTDNNFSDKELNLFCADVLVELKKIMHERKIEIPGYTMEV